MDDATSNGAATGRPGAALETEESAPVAASPPSHRLTCVCGHDRHHYLVSPLPTYTNWGKFWVIFIGVSTKPIRVDFKCRQCHQVFDFTEDSVELGRYL